METLTTCPRCGGTRIVRILWTKSVPWRETEAVKTGNAVLATDQMPQNPPAWGCLFCEPRWEIVHRLALEREKLFDKTVDAVANQKFDEAYRLKDLRVPLELQQQELIEELCGGPSSRQGSR